MCDFGVFIVKLQVDCYFQLTIFTFISSVSPSGPFEKVKDLKSVARAEIMIEIFIVCFTYCVSKKYWPILYSSLQYKMGHYFLDILYYVQFSHCLVYQKLDIKCGVTCVWFVTFLLPYTL